MNWIDSHCHLKKFVDNGKLSVVLENAKQHGVEQCIAVGTSLEDWACYRDLAKSYSQNVAWSVGLHPCYVDASWRDQAMAIAVWFADDVPPVALGEIGLDYFHLPKSKEEAKAVKAYQRGAFAYQLSVAYELECPVIIHSRNAFEDCVEMIDHSGLDWGKVVFHCFSEGPEQVALLNDRGGFASFTGIVTYKNAEAVRQAVIAQGVERIMLETDSPYLAPVPHRGQHCEPAFVVHTAEVCARLLNVSMEELSAKSTSNTRLFFGLGN